MQGHLCKAMKAKGKGEVKVYLLLFTCSLTRALHREILLNQTTEEFIQGLRSRRGRPKIVYSDNPKTFEKALKWINKV